MRGIGLPKGVPIDQALAESDAARWKARALRAEFILGIMAACFGERIGRIMSLLWPGPVTAADGLTYDGTDKIKAVRHDMIRNLFR